MSIYEQDPKPVASVSMNTRSQVIGKHASFNGGNTDGIFFTIPDAEMIQPSSLMTSVKAHNDNPAPL